MHPEVQWILINLGSLLLFAFHRRSKSLHSGVAISIHTMVWKPLLGTVISFGLARITEADIIYSNYEHIITKDLCVKPCTVQETETPSQRMATR